MLIPPQHLAALPACIQRMQRREAPLLAAARSGRFGIAILAEAMRLADEIH